MGRKGGEGDWRNEWFGDGQGEVGDERRVRDALNVGCHEMNRRFDINIDIDIDRDRMYSSDSMH